MPSGSPMDIPLSWVEAGRDLVAVEAEVSAGYLGVVYDGFRKAGLRVLGFTCSGGGPTLRCVGILDATNSGRSPEEVAAALSAMEGIASIEVIREPVRGFAAARGRVIGASGARAVVMTSRALLGLFLGARQYLGEEVGATFAYYAGFFSGREAARQFSSSLGREAAIRVHTRILESHGYASSIEVLRDAGGGRYRFEVRDLVECALLRGMRGGRTSHWFRGVLAGFLSELEGGDWDVEEVACVNDGSDACVFEARRR
ncbi:MAG: V4R domain-containing protein [Conexivisphaera sp.]